MREEKFPFRQFREYGDMPSELPDVDVDRIQNLGSELDKKKLIIVDDLTGSYRFKPVNNFGLHSYTGYNAFASEMRSLDTKPVIPVIDVLLGVEEKSRQVIHRAESLQLSLAHFIFHSLRRERALDVSLKSFSDSYLLKDTNRAIHTAESIAEIGYCMLNPHPGSMPSPTSTNAKYTVDMAQNVQDFGLYSSEHPEVLESATGYALMLFSYAEQQRRLSVYNPRYELAVKEFGTLQTDIDFSEPLSDDQLFAVKFE